MKPRIFARNPKESRILRAFGLGFLCFVLISSHSAAWSDYAFDPIEMIIRDGVVQDLGPVKLDLQAANQEIIEYQFIQEMPTEHSIAHSGSSSTANRTYQHVYTYNTSGGGFDYSVANGAGRSQTAIPPPQYDYLPSGYPIIARDNLILNGSILVVKSPETTDQRGLQASFDITANLQFEYMSHDGPQIINQPLMLGGLDLIGWVNDMVLIRPRGWITWRSISAIKNEFTTLEQESIKITDDLEIPLPINPFEVYKLQQEGDLFQIDLKDVKLPFYFWSRVGQATIVDIELISQVHADKASSGAEVIFMPDIPVIPGFHEDDIIPEPATIGLLGLGSLLLIRKKRRKYTR